MCENKVRMDDEKLVTRTEEKLRPSWVHPWLIFLLDFCSFNDNFFLYSV